VAINVKTTIFWIAAIPVKFVFLSKERSASIFRVEKISQARSRPQTVVAIDYYQTTRR
jgi:hypothetical protein